MNRKNKEVILVYKYMSKIGGVEFLGYNDGKGSLVRRIEFLRDVV